MISCVSFGILKLVATISKQDDKLVVKLSDIEKIETIRDGFEIPLESVRKVGVVENPIKEVHGLKPNHAKLYGMYLPGESAVGVFLNGGLRTNLLSWLCIITKSGA